MLSILSICILVILLLVEFQTTTATIARCQTNCGNSTGRKSGPTQPANTRQHPWKPAPFPTAFGGFCNLGCQLFFSEEPHNVTCKRACDYSYRYGITVDYSDLGEVAKLECRDGCDIALQTCQTGYYCVDGLMRTCPPGRFRESNMDLVQECIDCPVGRFRVRDKGTNADDCAKCPIGKYANETGASSPDSCLTCPAGQVAEEEGMGLCKCIKNGIYGSCHLEVLLGENITIYYKGEAGVDFFRESVPFVGRW
mmetsp:Transcript_302/g.686  ORF Transcript_302/g.686 Transcript_302/m.686 type:complete len:253 (+) Transcript_302:119-877(+)